MDRPKQDAVYLLIFEIIIGWDNNQPEVGCKSREKNPAREGWNRMAAQGR